MTGQDDTSIESQTNSHSKQPPVAELDLSKLPPIFVSATHFETTELHELEEELVVAGAILTYDIQEAGIVLSKVVKKPRVLFDLRAKGLWTQDVRAHDGTATFGNEDSLALSTTKSRDRPRPRQSTKGKERSITIDNESTESELESNDDARSTAQLHSSSLQQDQSITVNVTNALEIQTWNSDVIYVLKVDWFEQSRRAGKLLPTHDFLSYQGIRTDNPNVPATGNQASSSENVPSIVTSKPSMSPAKKIPAHRDILERAKEDASQGTPTYDRSRKRKLGHVLASNRTASWAAGQGTSSQHTHLLKQSTTEDDKGYSSDLPEMPGWVKARVKYACQRSTPKNSANSAFTALLKKISLARTLTNDEIGVRAYSSSIASILAYPYKIVDPREIMALPGCDAKIANLFIEWTNTGKIQAVEDIEADTDLRILRLFYHIWGVGATTAREFYYDRGWMELDDIVEFGWNTLSRVQQIGVKYYDEFQDPIPRAEVEDIGAIIHQHAVKVAGEGTQTLLVGGYRRGKEACGDVDIIVSHPDEERTASFIDKIVASLETDFWITHTLLLSHTSTKRGQQTLPFKTSSLHGGAGFDTLDKALVVWQNPQWSTKDADLAANPGAKNPNIHRRVDIIISPWRTVGCAIVGWSGGTTFERDLRRYAKNAKGWKFDSSGVRDRSNGEVIDLEGFHSRQGGQGEIGRAQSMEEAEKRVFQGLGLVYREPWERCTE